MRNLNSALIIAILWAASASMGWAQEVKLTSPQVEVVTQEPVFFRVTCEYASPPEKLPSFALLVDGKDTTESFACGIVYVREPDGKGGTKVRTEGSCHLGELGSRIDSGEGPTCTYESFRYLSWPGKDHFPGPGQYKVVARERKCGAVSKELLITVKQGTDGDRAVAEAVKGLYHYVSARTAEEGATRKKEGEAALRQAVADFPRSPITKYARHRLLECELESKPQLRSNAPEEMERVRAFQMDLLTRYGDLPEALPNPSQWHYEAAMALASSRSWQGDLAGARKELLKLDQMYGKHPVLGKGIRNWLESVERQMEVKPK